MPITQIIFCGLLTTVVLSSGNPQPIAIRADVDLVQLQATVTDTEGHTVSGLGKDSFQLFVDGVARPITVFQGEDAPVTAGIVIDNSASMGPKREEVSAAALAFARGSNAKDQIFVVHFNDRARLGLPPGTPFTGNISELETAIAAFDLGGTTAFYDALMFAQAHFLGAYYQRKLLVTVSDGGDNSSHATLTETSSAAQKAGIVIYPIGIFDENDRDRNPEALSTIAGQTGGEAFFPEHLADVTKICIRLAEHVRVQYSIGFPGAGDGQYHPIRVTAMNPKYGKLAVHTRRGYIATKSSNAVIQKR